MIAPQPGMARPVAIAGSGSVVSLVAVFAEAVVAVRLLSAEEYGTFVLATVVVAFLTMLADVGLKAATTQAVAAASGDDRAQYTGGALALRIVSITTVGLIAVAAGPVVRAAIDEGLDNAVTLVLAMFVATSLQEVLLSALRGYESHQAIAVLQVLRACVRLGVTSLLLVMDWGPEALAVSWALAHGVAAVGAFIALPERSFGWDREKAKRLLSFGWRAQLTRVVSYTTTFMPVAILGRYSSAAVVAVFAVAQRIPSGLQTVSDSFSTVYYPRMSALLARARRREAVLLLERSTMVSAALLGIVAAGGAFVGADLLGLLFGSSYTEAGGTFTLLLLALVLSVPNVIMGYALSSAGRPGGPAMVTLLEAAVLLPATLVLVDAAEFRAPAIASIAAQLVVLPAFVVLLKRADLDLDWRLYVVELVFIFAFVGVAALVASGLDGVVGLMLGAVIVAAVMFVALRVLVDRVEVRGWPSL